MDSCLASTVLAPCKRVSSCTKTMVWLSIVLTNQLLMVELPMLEIIQQAVENGKILIEYIPTADNIADIFMKALAKPKFIQFVEMLGLAMIKEWGIERATSAGDPQVSTGYLPKNTCRSGSTCSHGSHWIQVSNSDIYHTCGSYLCILM